MPSISKLYRFSAPTYSNDPKIKLVQKKLLSDDIYTFAKHYIAKKMATSSDLIQLVKTQHGKPFFTINNQPTPWHISVSHNKAFSLLQLATKPCAIDTELCHPRTQQKKLLAKLQQYFQYPARSEDFYPLWTLLEAWCKYHNQTLWQTLKQPCLIPHNIIKEYLYKGQSQYNKLQLQKSKLCPESITCIIKTTH